LLEGRKERDHSEDRGTDGCLGLEWILGILARACALDSIG
jgi:hypothetical protein